MRKERISLTKKNQEKILSLLFQVGGEREKKKHRASQETKEHYSLLAARNAILSNEKGERRKKKKIQEKKKKLLFSWKKEIGNCPSLKPSLRGKEKKPKKKRKLS